MFFNFDEKSAGRFWSPPLLWYHWFLLVPPNVCSLSLIECEKYLSNVTMAVLAPHLVKICKILEEIFPKVSIMFLIRCRMKNPSKIWWWLFLFFFQVTSIELIFRLCTMYHWFGIMTVEQGSAESSIFLPNLSSFPKKFLVIFQISQVACMHFSWDLHFICLWICETVDFIAFPNRFSSSAHFVINVFLRFLPFSSTFRR